LRAGWYYGETTEAFGISYRVGAGAKLEPGTYNNVMGNQALAWGLMAAAQAQRQTAVPGLVSDHSGQRHFARAEPSQEFRRADVSSGGRDRGDVRRRSERRFGGAMAVTTTSGPGIALKTEAMGWA
jgi:2-oxoglutarate/2-oxoacid ferredoxin oxidoreductase subunit alpha